MDDPTSISTSAWWEGVGLWYNTGEFRDAMNVWDEAIEAHWSSSSIREQHEGERDEMPIDGAIEPYSVEHLEATFCNINTNKNNNKHKDRPQEDDNSRAVVLRNDLAPLLLFLAGCYLDASDIVNARKCLFRCLLQCRRRRQHDQTAIIATAAIEEYMASYQEDRNCTQPWLYQRRLVEFAMNLRHESCNLVISKWKNPYQRAAYMYRGISSSKPVYPREEHPAWCRHLEEHAVTIQQEFETLFQNQNHVVWPRVGAGSHRDGAGKHDGAVVQSVSGGTWREIVLAGTGAHPRLAVRTAKLLPECVLSLAHSGAGEVIFSVLSPHTHIRPHTASHNLRLTAHLGLRVPSADNSKCYLRVANQQLHWEAGKMLVFDDSYEHEVVNDTDEIRGVLLLRFWHPSIPATEREAALQHVISEQQKDRLQRCNPPLPDASAAVTARGMEQTKCPTCWRTGYQSIRLLPNNNDDEQQHSFVCTCGRAINDE